MAENETPQILLEFFSKLDPGDVGADDEAEIHYGSPGVIRRAMRASKMLCEIQNLLGVAEGENAEGAGTPVEVITPEMKAQLEAQAESLAEAETEVDRLIDQNRVLLEEKESLKKNVKLLQRQVERLYNKNELTSLLGRLEDKPSEPAPEAPSEPAPKLKDEPELEPEPEAPKRTFAMTDETGGPVASDLDREVAETADAVRVVEEDDAAESDADDDKSS